MLAKSQKKCTSYMSGGNAKWYRHLGKQSGSLL